MRKSFFTLSGDVFVFINKRRNRIKLLHMEPGGLVLYSKLLAIGRKNYMFCEKDEAASRAAIVYSLIGSCKAMEVNPHNFIGCLLTNTIHICLVNSRNLIYTSNLKIP